MTGDAAGRRIRLPLCIELIGADGVQSCQRRQSPPSQIIVHLQAGKAVIQEPAYADGHAGPRLLVEQHRLPRCFQPCTDPHELGVRAWGRGAESAPAAVHRGRLWSLRMLL